MPERVPSIVIVGGGFGGLAAAKALRNTAARINLRTKLYQIHLNEQSALKKGTLMQLGMIGLGRMGSNMVRRLLKAGHNCVVFDVSPKAVEELVREKAARAPLPSRSGQKL